jgi:hypothetical protein
MSIAEKETYSVFNKNSVCKETVGGITVQPRRTQKRTFSWPNLLLSVPTMGLAKALTHRTDTSDSFGKISRY